MRFIDKVYHTQEVRPDVLNRKSGGFRRRSVVPLDARVAMISDAYTNRRKKRKEYIILSSVNAGESEGSFSIASSTV